MELPEPTGGDFVNLDSGTYLAVCYRFLDLGTHETNFQGQPGLRHEIMIGWETPEETITDATSGEVRPLSINKRYTWSMSQKANLRKDLEAWRGKPFEQSDFGPGGFNTKNLLGKPCMLTVVKAPNANGKEYSNVTGVGPVLKSLRDKVKAPWNKLQYLSLSHTDFDRELFNSLHDKLKEKIADSPEYKSLFGDGPKAKAMAEKNSYAKAKSLSDELSDDIPF